eukprot:CAMPEP_0117676888 /NCGR_PEP_ID=MMETSP0804-20121206/16449_1 /TAXON_ID=1074897 /ORGANISM="Tetraselmis astigmatica, Strain CCMP880" /LENGTH=2014 /DNA_ID=CAMNT_0005486129 /DNA_START=659 /DNA_END=6704 /DNA_ORIENTATION=-
MGLPQGSARDHATTTGVSSVPMQPSQGEGSAGCPGLGPAESSHCLAYEPDDACAQLRTAPSFSGPRWQAAGFAMAMHIDTRDPGGQTENSHRGAAGPPPALSPCGRFILVFGESAVIWSVEEGKVRGELDLPGNLAGCPSCSVFTPDGTSLVVLTHLGAIAAWDTETCGLIAILQGPLSGMTAGMHRQQSPCGNHVHTVGKALVWSGGRCLRGWDTATWEPYAHLSKCGIPRGHTGRILAARAHSDGLRMAALIVDGGKQPARSRAKSGDQLLQLAGEGYIKMWSLKTGEELSSTHVGRAPTGCWFSSSLDQAALWFSQPPPPPVSHATAAVPRRPPAAAGPASSLSPSPSFSNGRRRSLGLFPRLMQRWSRTVIDRSAMLAAAKPNVPASGFRRHSPLTGTDQPLPLAKCVEVWDLASKMVVLTHEDVSSQHVTCAFTAQGDKLAIQQGRHISLWDTRYRLQAAVFEGTTPMQFSPNGHVLACCDPSRPAIVVLWSAEAGTRMAELKAHNEQALAQPSAVVAAQSAFLRYYTRGHLDTEMATSLVVFSADSSMLLTAWSGPEATAVLWNVSAGASFSTITGRFCLVGPSHTSSEPEDTLLGVSPDARHVVVCRGRGRSLIEVWDASNGAPKSQLQGVNSSVIGFNFADDHTAAVVCSVDGSLSKWDLRTGSRLPLGGDKTMYFAALPTVESRRRNSSAEANINPLRDTTFAAAFSMRRLRRAAPIMQAASGDSKPQPDPFDPLKDDGSRGWRPTVSCCCISPSHDLAAQHYSHGKLLLLSVSDGHCVHILGDSCKDLLEHLDGVSGLAFACSGRRLVSASKEGSVVVWDTGSGEPVFAIPLAISPVPLRKVAGRPGKYRRMSVEHLPQWREELQGCCGSGEVPRILIHTNNVKVSPSTRLVAYLQYKRLPESMAPEHGCRSKQASRISAHGCGLGFAGALQGATLARRVLPLSLCIADADEDRLVVVSAVVQDTIDGLLHRALPLEEMRRELPESFQEAFQPSMCCWSGDSSTVAVYACTRGTPAVILWSMLPSQSLSGGSRAPRFQVLTGACPWSFSTCCLSKDAARLICCGEDPAIGRAMMGQTGFAMNVTKGGGAATARQQPRFGPEVYILPIQVWDVLSQSVMYTISHHTAPIMELWLSGDESKLHGYAASEVYTFTLGTVEGMDPDPQQILELSAREQICSLHSPEDTYSSPLSHPDSSVARALQEHPMLPNILDAEGRSLITLAAQHNDELLMQAILESSIAGQFGIRGATSHLNGLRTALQESPACVSLLLKALIDSKLQPHSSVTCVQEVLKPLLKKFPLETVAYLSQHGVVELGNFLISSTVGNLDKGMVTMASQYFSVQRPQVLWHGIAGEMMAMGSGRHHGGHRRFPRAKRKGGSKVKRELEVPVVAKVVPLAGCCRPGSLGLLQPLLHYPLVPISVWGVPIVHAVVAYKWRKFGCRFVINEFIAYSMWLLSYTIFLLLLPTVQLSTGGIVREEDTGQELSASVAGSPEGVFATACLLASFLITLRNIAAEVKQLRAYGFKEWSSSAWNVVDATSLALWMALVPMFFIQVDPVWLNPIVAINAILMWSKLLYFALAFESTSALVRMVLEIFYDMRHFLLLLVTVMIGFGCAFFVMFSGYDPVDEEIGDNLFSNPAVTMFTMFAMMLGLLEPWVLYDSPMPAAAVAMFVVYEVAVVIVLLNLLIAIMGDSFDKVRETEHLQFMRGRASVIAGIEATLRKEQLENKDWFPDGYIHILQRRYDDNSDQTWAGRIKAMERSQDRAKVEILEAVERAVAQARESLSQEFSTKLERLSEQLLVRGGGTAFCSPADRGRATQDTLAFNATAGPGVTRHCKSVRYADMSDSNDDNSSSSSSNYNSDAFRRIPVSTEKSAASKNSAADTGNACLPEYGQRPAGGGDEWHGRPASHPNYLQGVQPLPWCRPVAGSSLSGSESDGEAVEEPSSPLLAAHSLPELAASSGTTLAGSNSTGDMKRKEKDTSSPYTYHTPPLRADSGATYLFPSCS